MKQTWRWFGPVDKVSLQDVRQAGASGIVTALHHVPNGEIWTTDAISQRKTVIEDAQLTWDVVESLPVTEDIKRQTGSWRAHIENYKRSIENLSSCGIRVICYNFMPVLDWTRTDLKFEVPSGAKCMRFDLIDFAAFDIHILARERAAEDFPAHIAEQANLRHARMSDTEKKKLAANITCGLPGAEAGYDLGSLREQLGLYSAIDKQRLQQNQLDFLAEVIPVAEKCGARMCCHPDDPPFPLLGLPRIMSTEEDYLTLVKNVASPANGITLCSGSLGVLASNDLTGMVRRLGPHIHFAHLRNVQRESGDTPCSFYEAAHLEGSTDMVELVFALRDEEEDRQKSGRTDWEIPFRPDHGQDILTDHAAGAQPGYPAIGRLRGLAELRGIIAARDTAICLA